MKTQRQKYNERFSTRFSNWWDDLDWENTILPIFIICLMAGGGGGAIYMAAKHDADKEKQNEEIVVDSIATDTVGIVADTANIVVDTANITTDTVIAAHTKSVKLNNNDTLYIDAKSIKAIKDTTICNEKFKISLQFK
ncbi:hypothetical protein [uncultured Methanobrevibacter sp.]|uniref:hypothetical protein n=1 Tax=uncultured Methanobrevibacter sp. TaxID=253161 RepID=UPI0025EB1069|nr:hypothetical protein [uncultured Methanobrevibacter sp.]